MGCICSNEPGLHETRHKQVERGKSSFSITLHPLRPERNLMRKESLSGSNSDSEESDDGQLMQKDNKPGVIEEKKAVLYFRKQFGTHEKYVSLPP